MSYLPKTYLWACFPIDYRFFGFHVEPFETSCLEMLFCICGIV